MFRGKEEGIIDVMTTVGTGVINHSFGKPQFIAAFLFFEGF